jgi:hypothetical protein
VNRAGTVHRHVGDDAAPQQVDQDGRNPGLDDMAAEHGDDCAAAARGVDDCGDDLAQ